MSEKRIKAVKMATLIKLGLSDNNLIETYPNIDFGKLSKCSPVGECDLVTDIAGKSVKICHIDYFTVLDSKHNVLLVCKSMQRDDNKPAYITAVACYNTITGKETAANKHLAAYLFNNKVTVLTKRLFGIDDYYYKAVATDLVAAKVDIETAETAYHYYITNRTYCNLLQDAFTQIAATENLHTIKKVQAAWNIVASLCKGMASINVAKAMLVYIKHKV